MGGGRKTGNRKERGVCVWGGEVRQEDNEQEVCVCVGECGCGGLL